MEFTRDYKVSNNKIFRCSVNDDRKKNTFGMVFTYIFVQDLDGFQSGSNIVIDSVVTFGLNANDFSSLMDFLGEYFSLAKQMLDEMIDEIKNVDSELPDPKSLIDSVQDWLNKGSQEE